uniref:VPS10 domain-containing receptor SorCS2 (Trinotate prediction) n=1 Tax=Henneguya salminicola TaxID=69463 RepID=A0A6G3MEM3_HENSL
MMLAVLLFSYIIFINLPSSITINGYEEAIKRQINAEDTNPSIIEGKLSNSTNHLASQIKYDFKLKAIYILTYQKSEVGMIKDSKLYYSLLTDLYFTLIELKKPNLDFQFTRIEAGPEIIVGVSEMKNLIAISTNLGKDWIVNFLKFDGVDQIVISQQNRDHIAIVSKKGEIYLIIEFGARRSLQAYYGAQPIWPSISESLYLLEKSRFDTNIYVTKTDYISLRPSIVLKQAIDFGQSGNIIWVVTKDENKAHIHFIEKNDEVKKAHFPKFLKPKNFYPFNSNSQIFTIVINETNGVFFYTASTTDLRFIRIGDNIRPSFNSSIELCIAVETFEYLPGVLIMNMETISNEHQKIFTAISYNYGLKWTHILPPKTIKDLSCIWPSCYLKLTLECIKNNKNNSIIFSEKLPSLMISSGKYKL